MRVYVSMSAKMTTVDIFNKTFNWNYDIPLNFQRTADPYDENIKERPFQPVDVQKPQTILFCAKIRMENPDPISLIQQDFV